MFFFTMYLLYISTLMIIVMNEKMRKSQLFIELFTISKFSLSIAMRSAVLPVKCITLTFEIALGPESGLSGHKYHTMNVTSSDIGLKGNENRSTKFSYLVFTGTDSQPL